MNDRDRNFVKSFGVGGNSGDGITKEGNVYSSSWYLNSPDEFLKCIPKHYDPGDVDSCLIIDKREVLERSPGLAIRSPMCKAVLGEGEIDRFKDINDVGSSLLVQAFAQVAGEQRGLAALAAISLADPSEEPGSLNDVGPAAYAAWWRKHGARAGVLHCEPSPHFDWAPAA